MIAIADVAVVVSNARESARWWEKSLGFASHTIGGGSGHAVLVAPPGERLILHLCEGIVPLEPGDTGIAFLSDRIAQDCERMSRAGVRFPEPLHSEKWGARAKFSDPDGNIFWLLGVPTSMVRSTRRLRAPGPAVRSAGRPRARSPTRTASRRGRTRR